MGRMSWSGSPVALARMKTTTDRMASATSVCSTLEKTKRIKRYGRLLPRGELVEEEIVHDGPRIPLPELLGRRVGRVQVDDGHAEMLAADPRVDAPHQGIDL